MGYLGLTAGRAECEGFLCSNPAQPLLGEVTGAVARPGGTGEGRRCWWPLGPRAEVSTREERWSRGDEWAVARQSGLRNAPETGAGGPERVTRGGVQAQRCHSCYLPLSGDPCRHPHIPWLLATLWGPLQAPAHPMAAGSGVAWGGQGACLGLPTVSGWLRGWAGLFSTKQEPADQADQAALPSRLQTAGHPWAPQASELQGWHRQACHAGLPHRRPSTPPGLRSQEGKGQRERSGGQCAGSEGGALEGSGRGGGEGGRRAVGEGQGEAPRPRAPVPAQPRPVRSGHTVPSRKAQGSTAEDQPGPAGALRVEIY